MSFQKLDDRGQVVLLFNGLQRRYVRAPTQKEGRPVATLLTPKDQGEPSTPHVFETEELLNVALFTEVHLTWPMLL